MKIFKIALALVVLSPAVVGQERSLPLIRSNSRTVSIKDGNTMKLNGWTLTPDLKPDIYEAQLAGGKPHRVEFISDIESIGFMVEEGKTYDFVIQHGDQRCLTQIVGVRFVPAAVFDRKYQAEHKGKTSVEVPEVYELVNVAIAMTPTGLAHKNLIYKNSDYYNRMREWFDKYQDHSLLSALDTELKKNLDSYHNLKMNGYAFEFDKDHKIVQSPVYDRSGWGPTNPLRPFLAHLQAFSDATDFRGFFRRNAGTYREQIAFYRDAANIAEMKRWLDKHFPTSNDYDTYKIIFSPLVFANQSQSGFESDGFKELQAHVNFPYAEEVQRYFPDAPLSERARSVFRGNIVFTEINHGYIGPEGAKYADRILRATSNRDHWIDAKMGANYYGGSALFDEYMNWGLISLRISDLAPEAEQDKMIAFVERAMTRGRGFVQFAEFNKYLLNLYRGRQPNRTVADLYPLIIEWFEKNNLTGEDGGPIQTGIDSPRRVAEAQSWTDSAYTRKLVGARRVGPILHQT